MQALERVVLSENFITILLVVALSFLAMLKSLNSEKLKGSVFAVFNTVFLEDETEENDSFFSPFNLILFLFSSVIISLLLYKFLNEFSTDFNQGFFSYSKLLLLVFSYFLIKWFFEFLIKILFLIKHETAFYSISKSRSLYSISFGFLCILLLTIFTELSSYFLIFATLSLLIVRFAAIVLNNKNLIVSKLFYFILYLCAFEIAPLFVLFKLFF